MPGALLPMPSFVEHALHARTAGLPFSMDMGTYQQFLLLKDVSWGRPDEGPN